jgi:predicted porin
MNTSKLKSLAAAVALSCASTGAMADMTIAEADDGTKLSMFGIIDVGVLYQDKFTAQAEDTLQIESSGMRQSVFGWKGSRPMFNGSTVFFNLEAHFDIDSGMFHNTADDLRGADADDESGNLAFRRQANLGMTGDWGTVIVGRQYGPALLAHLASEPRVFRENFSNLYAWAYTQLFNDINAANAGGRNTNNDVGIFMKNSVQYRNNIQGLDFGVLYSFGGVEGSLEDNSILALGASYPIGNVTLTGSWQQMKDQQTGNSLTDHWSVGAAYKMNDFTFRANYMDAKNETDAGVDVLDFSGLGLGVEWAWNEKNALIVAYYNNEDDTNAGGTGGSAETDSWVISNDYLIAPSTTLYSVLSVVDVDANAGVVANFATSIVANPAPVGETTTFVNVGVNYQF